MALQPIASLTQSSDCTQLFFNDITGAYNAINNTGGYGAPNSTVAQVTSVTVSGTVYLPTGATITIPVTTLFPTTQTPTFSLNQSWILTTTILGLAGSNFPDGIYTLTYTVNSTISASQYTYTYTWQQLITCNADCCIGNVLSSLDPCDCNCEDVSGVCKMFGLLMGAKAACGATMNSKSLDMLNVVNQWCSKQSCNCG